MPKKYPFFCFCFSLFFQTVFSQSPDSWIRINQLGYKPDGVKVAVFGAKQKRSFSQFELVNAETKKTVFTAKPGKQFGRYGPFESTHRLDFSSFKKSGRYFIRADNAESPVFSIDAHVYDGAADFCLRYMRQQRSGFNPFLKDSCHVHDGYTLYAPVPDSTHIDVVGGWHDATDYLQYSSTSANAAFHLLAAYRDFPGVFSDEKQANGLDGKNNIPDVLDEAKWGLDWLLKMHPRSDWLFNQLADDRDHNGMRLPKEDTNFYGRGLERPVYFCSGEPQVRGKFMNNTTGVASTAGKFASAFALGSEIFARLDRSYSDTLLKKALSAFNLGLQKPGACQTASVKSPYIYAEDNWTDDMELGSAMLFKELSARPVRDDSREPGNSSGKNKYYRDLAFDYAKKEPITPWLGKDTAKHYQWYPFINIGHYELAEELKGARRDTIIAYYRKGIDLVWQKSKRNAFYRAIPYIWCSNNLTVSFAIQCYWYRRLTGDKTYIALEQACFDWIFGCNPWGKSMVYGLPSWGDTPHDPHSSFTHLFNYPIDGGMLDGPVYTSIYKNLLGIELHKADAYAAFQSELAVYHDDFGDYSTNEPTMDGTASLIYLLAAQQAQAGMHHRFSLSHGGIVRGDSTKKEIALVFTADEFGEGLPTIIRSLKKQQIKASFFFTGRFYRNASFHDNIKRLIQYGCYLGPHSNEHLLYCDWDKRDSLLVTKQQFSADLQQNLETIRNAGIDLSTVNYFIPPYEWWNDSIALWSKNFGLKITNFTPGIRTNTDYTYLEMGQTYKSTEWILRSVKDLCKNDSHALNGAIILVHAGTDPRRKDKLFDRLDELIGFLKSRGYRFRRIDELLKE